MLFVSGYTDQAALPEHALPLPLHFLAKPATLDDLLRRVRKLIDLPRQGAA